MRYLTATLASVTVLIAVSTPRTMADPRDALRPVDQSVGDIDVLSTSLRQVGAGLRNDGEHTSLFAIPQQPGAAAAQHRPAYLRVAPGYNAQVDRIEYLARTGKKELQYNVAPIRDGEYIEVIPANTVFLLDPQAQLPDPAVGQAVAAPGNQVFAEPLDPRLNNRVSTQINTMVTPQAIGQRRAAVSTGGWHTPMPVRVRGAELQPVRRPDGTPLSAATPGTAATPAAQPSAEEAARIAIAAAALAAQPQAERVIATARSR